MADDVWVSISQLHQLRSLSFHSMTSFTFEGIMDYISGLGNGNRGLHLYIMNATMESELSHAEQVAIGTALAESVDGRFEFVLHREVEFDSEEYSD